MICLISDTHENVKAIKVAVAAIKEFSPSLVIHCGDIISPPILDHFEGLPMRFVFGNNDGEKAGLRSKAEELGFGSIEEELELTHEGKLLYAYHGTDPDVIENQALVQEYDYIFHGHTHETKDELVGKTRIINPGALFAAPTYTFAALDLGTGKVEFVEISKYK